MTNPIDRIYEFFAPEIALKRQQARNVLTTIRKYDFASGGRRNTGFSRRNTSGAQEASAAASESAATGQELVRNNPLAQKIKTVWQSNVVGGGIQLDATAKSKPMAKKFNLAFDEWADSTDCDFEGHHNFYGLQNLWMGTAVESGGVFIIERINKKKKFPLQLQTLEQEYLDKSKNGFKGAKTLVDGIQYDENHQIEGYWFIDTPVSVALYKKPTSKFYKASRVIHIYRKDRVGQHLGVTWFGSIVKTLDDLQTSTSAKLMQQQVAACFGMVIEGAENQSGIGGDGTSEMPDKLEPGMIEYTQAGQKVHTVNPPKVDNSSDFDVSVKRDAAAGVGITYEQLTGDYSKVNFASARMAKNDFFSALDGVQQFIFKPALNKVLNWFIRLYEIKNGVNGNFKPDWTFPPRASVNPQEEFDVLMSKVRHGMLSPQKAAKILGERLEKIVAQWKEAKEIFGELPFDIDPSKFAATGNQLIDQLANAGKDKSKDKGKENAED